MRNSQLHPLSPKVIISYDDFIIIRILKASSIGPILVPNILIACSDIGFHYGTSLVSLHKSPLYQMIILYIAKELIFKFNLLTHNLININFISKFGIRSTPSSGYSNFIANKTKSLIYMLKMFLADWMSALAVGTVIKLCFSRVTIVLTTVTFEK